MPSGPDSSLEFLHSRILTLAALTSISLRWWLGWLAHFEALLVPAIGCSPTSMPASGSYTSSVSCVETKKRLPST